MENLPKKKPIDPPNYTQIPNIFFDEIMKNLNGSELLVMLVVMRKTFGWQKERDKISLTQIQKISGLSRQGVLNGLYGKDKKSGLVGSGYVIAYNDAQGNWYEINTAGSLEVVNEVDQSHVVNEVDHTSQQSRLNLVNNVDQETGLTSQQSRHTKERLNKNKESLNKLPPETELLAKLMVSLHQQYQDPHYNPSSEHVQTWRKDIDLLHRKNGRSWEEIEKVIRFAKTMPLRNGFTWATNIMSGAKLRDKFDQLLPMAIQSGNNSAWHGPRHQVIDMHQGQKDIRTEEEKKKDLEEVERLKDGSIF